jgi:hypothetical protein
MGRRKWNPIADRSDCPVIIIKTMDTKGFCHAVSLGLGRAVLQMPEHLETLFHDAVLDSCLRSKARDPQVEGSRAQYLLDIVRRSGEPSFYTRKVLDALSEEADPWDELQRFQIARVIAKEGDHHARQAMVDAFERQIGSSMQNLFAEEFIILDRIHGLLFALERIGYGLRYDRTAWVDDTLLATASESLGQESVWNAVTERAKTDRNVSSYLEAVKANRLLRQEDQSIDTSSVTYEQIRSMIVSGKIGGLVRWGQTADPAELELAASDLIKEIDVGRLPSYLMIFRQRAFPLGSNHLLQLAAMPDGPVARRALAELENLQDDKVRSLALELVETGSPFRGYAVGLLTNNFRDGDHELVRAWCDNEGAPEVLNDFDRSLAKFFAAHPNDGAESQILPMLYDREPCSHCRHAIVERLLHLKRLSEDLRSESAHDSYLATRALVNAR